MSAWSHSSFHWEHRQRGPHLLWQDDVPAVAQGGQPALPEKDPWVGHPQQAGSRPVSGCGAATQQPGLGKEGPGSHSGVGSSRVGGGVIIQKGRGRPEWECCCFISYSPIISQRLRSWGAWRSRGGGRHSVPGRLRGAPGWVPEPSRQGSAQGPSGGRNEGSSHIMSLIYMPQPPVSKLGGRGLGRGAWRWEPQPGPAVPPCPLCILAAPTLRGSRPSGGAGPVFRKPWPVRTRALAWQRLTIPTQP